MPFRASLSIVILFSLISSLCLAATPVTLPADPAVEELAATIRNLYVEPAVLGTAELKEAIAKGQWQKLGAGVNITNQSAAARGEPNPPVYFEVVSGRYLYIRLLSLRKAETMKNLESEIKSAFAKNQILGCVLDLRGYSSFANYEEASQFLSWFVGKGELFSLVDNTGKRLPFASSNPAWIPGMPMAIAINQKTEGVAEIIAGVLREKCGAVLMGHPTAGLAITFAEKALGSNRYLRVANRRAVLSDGAVFFPNPVKVDISVEFDLDSESEVMGRILGKGGVAAWLDRPGSVRQTEAFLAKGENPDIDRLREQLQRRKQTTEKVVPPKTYDLTLQRAFDFLHALDALGRLKPAAPGAVQNWADASPATPVRPTQ